MTRLIKPYDYIILIIMSAVILRGFRHLRDSILVILFFISALLGIVFVIYQACAKHSRKLPSPASLDALGGGLIILSYFVFAVWLTI
jgi:hypothetical protein